MYAKGVQNMWSILVVVNKHNTARVTSCWFIIYYSFSSYFSKSIWRIYKNKETNIILNTDIFPNSYLHYVSY